MKRLRILSIFMVLFAVLGGIVASCETEPVDPLLLTDDNGGTDTIADPGIFTVKIGGTLFVADSTIATLGNGQIVIKGYKGTEGENVTITVQATTTGTYTALMVYDPGTSDNFYSNISPASGPSGSATITTINTAARVISGSFSFTGYYSDTAQNLPNVAFTEGIFTNISYGGGTPPTNPSGPGVFTASVDGAPFTAAVTNAVLGSGLFSIQGVDASGKAISIAVEETTPGTYTGSQVLLAYYENATSEDSYSNLLNDTGTLTITSIDTVNHTITGTFSFTGDYSDIDNPRTAKVITSGVFTNVPYVGSIDNTDIFTATVNGTAITYGGSDLVIGFIDVNEFSAVTLRGTNATHVIELQINEDTPVGTYPFTDAVNALPKATFTDTSAPDDITYNITRGSLVITANDGVRIKGTFSFEVRNPANPNGAPLHTVTGGTFDIEL